MNNNKKMMCVAAGLAIGLFFALVISLALNAMVRVPNTGKIKTLGLQCDTEFVDWGIIEPNTTATQTINLKLNGTSECTLSLNTTDWIPENASEYMALSWNYTDAVLESNVWYPVELSLYVSADIKGVTDFSFDIWIIATEA